MLNLQRLAFEQCKNLCGTQVLIQELDIEHGEYRAKTGMPVDQAKLVQIKLETPDEKTYDAAEDARIAFLDTACDDPCAFVSKQAQRNFV